LYFAAVAVPGTGILVTVPAQVENIFGKIYVLVACSFYMFFFLSRCLLTALPWSNPVYTAKEQALIFDLIATEKSVLTLP
jgi:hypothetical protein